MKTFDERTLVLIKPDGVQRRLVGEIIQRFERAGLKIVALKFLLPSKELVEKHYPSDEDWSRKITGSTEPLTSDVGTIRGDLTIDSYSVGDADSRAVRNLIHASESPDEAEREINVWFKKEELVKYRLLDEVLLTDINLEGLK